MPIYAIIGVLVVAMVLMSYFLFFRDKGEIGGEGAAQIRQMQEMTQQVQELESDVKEKENEIFSLVDEYKDKTGENTLGINALELGEDGKKILEQKITEEKDVSPEYFTTSIDMRTQNQVVFSALDFGIRKIKKVTLYPKFHKEGIDLKLK